MAAVTTKTIASDLGLTTAAVSIALNPPKSGTSKVSAATAERVRAYAAKLNYRPSLASRAMKFRRLQQIGLVLHSDFGVRRHYPTVEMPAIFGLNEFLDSKGWHLNIINDSGDRGAEVKMPRYLQEKGIDGVVVCSRSSQRDETIDHDLRRFSIPAVYLNATGPYNCVGLDDHWGGAEATRHLIDFGHREIVFLGRRSLHPSVLARQAGYEEAMKRAGLTPFSFIEESPAVSANDYQARLALHRAMGQKFVQEILLARRPTAIFCYDDGLALVLMRALHDAKISVPEEVSIIGFNDLPYMDIMPPPLTTMRSDFYEMARRAGEFLFQLIEDPSRPVPSVQFRPELVVRETTRRLAS
jgi:DNA-binding LacI/PurR family transcriptional regulator